MSLQLKKEFQISNYFKTTAIRRSCFTLICKLKKMLRAVVALVDVAIATNVVVALVDVAIATNVVVALVVDAVVALVIF